jgi:hypothetical protein
MSGFTSLQQLTSAEGKVLAGITVTPNTTRKRIFVTGTDPAWTGMTLGEIVAGLVIYLHVTNFASSIPIGALPRPVHYTITADGLFTWEWGDDGILEF